MKHGFKNILRTIGIVGCALALFLAYCGCRSSKHTVSHVAERTERSGEVRTIRTDSVRIERKDSISAATATLIDEHIRTVIFSDDGRIQQIQDERRTIGSTQLVAGTRQSSEVHVSEEVKDSTYTDTQDVKTDIKKQTITDSRPVQGSEWVWIGLAVGAVFIVMVIILIKKFGK